ncbi:uracil-DNA glycosylase [Devosia rhodophyticola]|uniref:Type-4 uracil-DNA glycosylase n=1 Tax=Devosia rhodophyticola TaxID=3026423 RepID=A0ABY7YZT3_9HYPH|nr:uracil-DNA glycosylase [Devosia rhodophyticola]WDR06520.1 uracil-DNA glycosylase [Devosia rhodophyticola]
MVKDRPLNHAEMVSVLEWYRDAGVDLAVLDEPVDRFAQATAASSRRPALPPTEASAPAPAPIVTSMAADPAEARTLAASAQTLEQLAELLGAYEGCGLKQRATQLVFADGNPEAEIMLIGEAPGAEEDRQGKPFVGKSGQLLDLMLAAIGLDRTRVYIANTVPWRPPGNRAPTPEELTLCLPFLVRQVELVAPKVIVTLGGPAMQSVFGVTTGILKMRGKWDTISLGAHSAEAMPTLHPAYLLRSPAAKHQAWRDMLALRLKLNSLEITQR